MMADPAAIGPRGTRARTLGRAQHHRPGIRPCQRLTYTPHPRTIPVSASSNGLPESSGAQPSGAERWDNMTNRLVSLSSIPFSVLVLPQVVQNIVAMSAGNISALKIISWEGYLSGLLGNTLMCSHFANSGERSAVNVQLIGIANNMTVLLQVALASCMPREVFIGVAAAVALAVSMSLGRLSGRIPATVTGTKQLSTWQTWQLVSGVLGLAVVPQVLYNVMFPATPTYAPGAVTLLALTCWYALKANQQQGDQPSLRVEQLPGIASTLLFALSPLPQLVRNFVDSSGLEGLSVGTMLLALAGNALMVPRALFIQDAVWLTGTSWACTAGWGQLLSMVINKSQATGLTYVQPAVFAAVTAVLMCYFGYVWHQNTRAKPHLNGV